MGNVPAPLRSSQPAADILTFFTVLDKAFKLHLGTTNVPLELKPVLIRQFPKERVSAPDDPFDVITSRVVGAALAPSSNTSDRTAIRPTVRERRPDPKVAGYNLVTYGWWENVAVAFDVWSKSTTRADLLTSWFHRFMIKYAHILDFFRARGIDKFEFVERKEDTVEQMEGQELYKRTLVYQFRLENLDTVLEKQLTDVSVNLAITDETTALNVP